VKRPLIKQPTMDLTSLAFASTSSLEKDQQHASTFATNFENSGGDHQIEGGEVPLSFNPILRSHRVMSENTSGPLVAVTDNLDDA